MLAEVIETDCKNQMKPKWRFKWNQIKGKIENLEINIVRKLPELSRRQSGVLTAPQFTHSRPPSLNAAFMWCATLCRPLLRPVLSSWFNWLRWFSWFSWWRLAWWLSWWWFRFWWMPTMPAECAAFSEWCELSECVARWWFSWLFSDEWFSGFSWCEFNWLRPCCASWWLFSWCTPV